MLPLRCTLHSKIWYSWRVRARKKLRTMVMGLRQAGGQWFTTLILQGVFGRKEMERNPRSLFCLF